MQKAIIIYESKFGNTRIAAEMIAEGMNQQSGLETVISELSDVDLNAIDDFKVIVIGSPNHIGRATRSIKKFVSNLGKLGLKGKRGAVFDTYMARDFEKAVKKLEKQIREDVPGLPLLLPGLSVKVDGMKGPISEGELPKCREFGLKIATAADDKSG